MEHFNPDSFEGQVLTRLARIEENLIHTCEAVSEHEKVLEKVKGDVSGLKVKAAIFGSILGTAAGFLGAWIKTKLGF